MVAGKKLLSTVERH